jgi:hypothetical protein
MDLYSGSRAEMDQPESVSVAVFGLLQMPQFLYLLENQPDDAEPITLDGQEIAQRMALLYWNGLPDDELAAAAESGALADPETRRSHAAHARRRAREAGAEQLHARVMMVGLVSDQHSPELSAALRREPQFDAAPRLRQRPETAPEPQCSEQRAGFSPARARPDDWHEASSTRRSVSACSPTRC